MSEAQIPEYQLPHEQLTDERLGDLLAGLGNHEGKALLVLALGRAGDDEFFGKSALHRLISQLPGADQAYVGDLSNQMAWCKNSLEPIGLVAKADFGETLQFAISEEGKKQGIPLAALLLDFADKHHVSLAEIFGSSQSRHDLRAPMSRYNTIQELLTNPEGSRVEDLVAATGLASGPTARNHLRSLANVGLIDYDEWDQGNDQVTYERTDQDIVPKREIGPLRQTMYEFISSKPTFTLDEISEYCAEHTPDENIASINPAELRIKLTSYMNHMMNEGYIERVKGKQPPSEMIRARLDAQQEAFWLELVNALETFKDGNTTYIAQLKQRAAEILADKAFIARALDRAAENSPLLQNGSEKSLDTLVTATLHEEGPLSIRDLVARVSELRGRDVSVYGIRGVVRKLLARDGLVVVQDKVRKFSLPTLKD